MSVILIDSYTEAAICVKEVAGADIIWDVSFVVET